MVNNYITIDGSTTTAEIEADYTNDTKKIQNFFRDEDKVPLSKLTKYYLNENLNFYVAQELLYQLVEKLLIRVKILSNQ